MCVTLLLQSLSQMALLLISVCVCVCVFVGFIGKLAGLFFICYSVLVVKCLWYFGFKWEIGNVPIFTSLYV